MRICSFPRLLFLLLVANGAGIFAQEAKLLKIMINDLVPIARLTNGIALETELLTDAKKANDVVAEFLGIRSGDDVVVLRNMDMNGLVKGLSDIYSAVENVPMMQVDMQALRSSFEALEAMKTHSAVINSTVAFDSAELGRQIGAAASMSVMRFTTFDDLQKVIAELNEVAEKTAEFSMDPKQHLISMKKGIAQVVDQLNAFLSFDSNLGPMLKLQNIKNDLSDMKRLANVSKQFVENFATLSTMDSNLGGLKTGVAQLKPVINLLQTMSQITNSVSQKFATMKSLSGHFPTLSLTVGFSGKVGTIGELFGNLKSGLLNKVLAKGKDTKSLEESLKLLTNFNEIIQSVYTSWTKSVPRDWNSTEDAVQILKDMVESGSRAPDTSTLESSLDSIRQCFGGLKKPAVVPNYNDASALFAFAEKLSPQIAKWKHFFEKKKLDFVSTRERLNAMKTLTSVNDSAVMTFYQTTWNTIHNVTDIKQLVANMTSIHTGLTALLKDNPIKTLEENTVNVTVLSDILSSLAGTNMTTMVSCIQSQTYSTTDIESTLNIGASVQTMKSNKQSFESIRTICTEMEKVKSGLVEIAALGKSRRRRRDANGKSLKNLENAQTVSYDLGMGVRVLEEFGRILENSTSVLAVANCVDPTKSVVAAIPAAQAVWTEKNRNDMKKMITDLQELERSAGIMKRESLADLWQVFSKANLIPGVFIDAAVFADPIAIELSKNQLYEVKLDEKYFKTTGGLNLNFAQHSVSLQRAFQTLNPLQKFFDDYFDQSSGNAAAQGASDDEFPLMAIIVTFIVLLILVAVIGVAAWFVRKYVREQLKWKNRERYWIYEMQTCDWYEDVNTAVQSGVYPKVHSLIKQGNYVDFFGSFVDNQKHVVSATPLYCAVAMLNPEIVELLIVSGADRSLRASNGLTAEEMLKTEGHIVATTEKTKTSMADIEALFTKYKQMTFRPKIPNLLPLDYFVFYCSKFKEQSDREKIAKFKSCFSKKVVFTKEVDKATHVLYDTDDQGYAILDGPGEDYRDGYNLAAIGLFYGCPKVMLKISYVTACLKSKRNLRNDYKHRITKVRYNKKSYETVDEWKKWTNGRAVPCLFNVDIAYIAEATGDHCYNDFPKQFIERLGGKFVDCCVLMKGSAERKTAPYWFPELNRHWYLYPSEEVGAIDKGTNDIIDATKADNETEFLKLSFEQFLDKLMSLNGWKSLTSHGVVQEESSKSSEKTTKSSMAPQSENTSNMSIVQA